MGKLASSKDGLWQVQGAFYSLEICGHLVKVYAEGTLLATLDIRSAVPQTLDDNTGAIPDAEPSIPTLQSAEIGEDSACFTWENESSLWHKTYTLCCDRLRWHFSITLCGKGRVDAVQYFSGDSSSQNYGSAYEFSEGFMTATNMKNLSNYRFSVSENFHGYSEELVPPLFCYVFRTEGCGKRLGLGLVAQRGEHNFHAFDYRVTRSSKPYPWTGFWLETDQAGHTCVDGTWTTPEIYGFVGEDPWEILADYTAIYRSLGIARPYTNREIPRFWRGPILCGYIEQLMEQHTRGVHWMKLANAEFYEELLQKANALGLAPKTLIIDDKWQTHYACGVADEEKFPHMRNFIQKRHQEGLKVLLWFKLWDAQGAEEEYCTYDDAGNRRIDPSHPEYLKRLRENLHLLLSSEEGCYDADGLKIDFGFFNPVGRKVKTHSGKYGVELFYDYLETIYRISKGEKAYALMNSSPCHPYFADICD